MNVVDFPTHFMQPLLHWYQKYTSLENYRPLSPTNTGTEILNKTLSNLIQQHIERIRHQEQKGFIATMQGVSTYKTISAIHRINGIKHKTHMIFSIEAERAFDKCNILSLEKDLTPSRWATMTVSYKKGCCLPFSLLQIHTGTTPGIHQNQKQTAKWILTTHHSSPPIFHL